MGMLNRPEIERRAGFHPATDATAPVFEANRAAVIELMVQWDETLPPGRELALAMTALQEALMWANAAVACETPLAGGYHSRSRALGRPYRVEVAELPDGAVLDDRCTCFDPVMARRSGHLKGCPAR